VQNSCICTFSKDGGEINFTINTAFFDETFLTLKKLGSAGGSQLNPTFSKNLHSPG